MPMKPALDIGKWPNAYVELKYNSPSCDIHKIQRLYEGPALHTDYSVGVYVLVVKLRIGSGDPGEKKVHHIRLSA